ncbi:hypothetical protein TcYC6_0114590 [Trypanosoma cruzi]|nr:hypothetical protein TcYC6_0114560 [Trypanosoma cruzi]KAF8292612.1 hypothetical protein TcYC6_0114590 [Trypanosoma cruzi]RNC61564.1 hypothetical protein TcCL_ESM00642 [Trypanosoma cruzi]
MRRRHVCYFGPMAAVALLLLIDSAVSIPLMHEPTPDNKTTDHPRVFPVHSMDSPPATSSYASASTRFLYAESRRELAGKGRAVPALPLTSIQYRGVARLRETLPTWMEN